MAFKPPIRIVFSGNHSACQEHIKFATKQLAILEQQMSFQGLNEGVRRVSPYAGVFVECISSFSLHEVRIAVDQEQNVRAGVGGRDEKEKCQTAWTDNIPLVASVRDDLNIEKFKLFNLQVSFAENPDVKFSNVWWPDIDGDSSKTKRTYSGDTYIQVKHGPKNTTHGFDSSLEIIDVKEFPYKPHLYGRHKIESYVRAVLTYKKRPEPTCDKQEPVVDYSKLIEDPPSILKNKIYSSSMNNDLIIAQQVELWCDGFAAASFNETKDQLFIAIRSYDDIDVSEVKIRRIVADYLDQDGWVVSSDESHYENEVNFHYGIHVDSEGRIYGWSEEVETDGPSPQDPCNELNEHGDETVIHVSGLEEQFYTFPSAGPVSYTKADEGAFGTVVSDGEFASVSVTRSQAYWRTTTGHYYHDTYDVNTSGIQVYKYHHSIGCVSYEGIDVSKHYPYVPNRTYRSGDGVEDKVWGYIDTEWLYDGYLIRGLPARGGHTIASWTIPDYENGSYTYTSEGTTQFYRGTMYSSGGSEESGKIKYQGYDLQETYDSTVVPREDIIHSPVYIENASPVRSFHCVDNSVDPVIEMIGVYYKNMTTEEKKWIITINGTEVQDEVFMYNEETEDGLVSRIESEKNFSYLGLIF